MMTLMGRPFPPHPEQRVVMALKAQLADTRAIERYIKPYREGRKRLARENAGKREALERTRARAEREVGQRGDGSQRGITADEEARKRLPEAQRRDAANADLAAVAPATTQPQ